MSNRLDWSSAEVVEVIDASVRTESAQGGIFRFDEAPAEDLERGSVIWITHPSHGAAFRILPIGVARASEPESEEGHSLGDIVLDAAREVGVRVVDAVGSPVVGASVHQYAVVPNGADTREDGPQVPRFFCRRGVTDADGRWSARPISQEAIVWASRGEAISEPYIGLLDGEIELRLLSSFLVEGVLRPTTSPDLPGPVRIRAIHLADEGEVEGDVLSRGVECGRWTAAEAGSWGPMQVPRLEGGSYVFRLEGGGAVATEVERRVAATEQRLVVDFDVVPGSGLWFDVVDESFEAIPNASVTARWMQGERQVSSRATPRFDGYTHVRGIPPGEVFVAFDAPGYVSRQEGPYLVPEPEPAINPMQLARAAKVQGRCMLAGRPASDFRVVVWPVEGTEQAQGFDFVDAEDGSFLIEDAPSGQVGLLAYAPGRGQSSVVHADLGNASPSVTLELQHAVTGRGRVVDRGTGEPVADATIEHWASVRSLGLEPRTVDIPVDSSGAFVIDELSPVPSQFRVVAPEYSPQLVTAGGPAGGEVDLGVIHLARRQPLEIRLVSSDAEDFTSYSARSHGSDALPARAFSAEGVVRYESVDTGTHMLLIYLPDMTSLAIDVELKHGEPWQVEIAIEKERRLIVSVQMDEPVACNVNASYFDSQQRQVQHFIRVTESSDVTFHSLPPGDVVLNLLDPEGNPLAATTVALGHEPETHALLRVGEGTRTFRVVDVHGEGVAAARLLVVARDGSGRTIGITDARGACTLPVTARSDLLAHISHAVLGVDPEVPVQLPERSEEDIVLTLSTDAAVRLELADGDVALAGVRCRLTSAQLGLAVTSDYFSDSLGELEWEHLGNRTYVLEASHPSCWPVRTEVRTGPSQAVAMRRVGGVVLELRDLTGGALADVPIELVDLETGGPVASWDTSNTPLVLPPQGLRTDASGRLAIGGLPRGRYRWSAILASSTATRGELEVLAGTTVQAAATLAR